CRQPSPPCGSLATCRASPLSAWVGLARGPDVSPRRPLALRTAQATRCTPTFPPEVWLSQTAYLSPLPSIAFHLSVHNLSPTLAEIQLVASFRHRRMLAG